MSLGFNNSRFLKGHRSTKIKTVKANDSWNGIPKEAVSIVPRSHKVGRFFLPVFTRCSTQSSDAYAPYGLTIAYGENIVQNGVRISLNTAVLGIKIENVAITAVETNRGTLYLALVWGPFLLHSSSKGGRTRFWIKRTGVYSLA